MIRSSIVTLCAIAFFASLVFTGIVYAQNQTQNQTSSQAASQNETMATVTDKPQTVIANQTTVPAEQTTVTVNQTTEPITIHLSYNPYKTRRFLLKQATYLILRIRQWYNLLDPQPPL